MTDPMTVPFVVAMAQPAQGQGNILIQLFPFVLMIGIFYLLVLMPMRKRQKKVQEFQGALKVGDKIVTTSGIYGQITRVVGSDRPGPDRRQSEDRGGASRDWRLPGAGARRAGRVGWELTTMYTNLRWKILLILAVTALSVWAFYPPSKKVKQGLDLKGGVHMVLKVHTDDALKLETETASEQLREALTTASIPPTAAKATSLTEFTVEGIPPAGDAQFKTIADQQVTATFDRESRGGGTYVFRMRPNIR